MRIRLRKLDEYTIIDLNIKKTDSDIVIAIRKILRKQVTYNNVNILINMSLVETFEYNFVECLLKFNRICMKKGGQIKVYGVQTNVLTIFFVIQLDKRINIYNNEIDAINHNNLLFKRRLKVI